MLLILPAAAHAQTTQVLVSNIGQAQGFTTGSNSAGYTLTSIEVNLSSAGNVGSAVVRKTDPNTGDLVATLTGTGTTSDTGNRTFTAPSNTSLDPSTEYFVVFESDASTNGLVFSVTNADAEDTGGAAGWSINDLGHFRNRVNTGSFQAFEGSKRIRVNGTIKSSTTTNAAPTASNKTVTTNEDTDHTFAAANFNFADTDTGDTLSSVKIVTLPATGKGTLELSGTAVTANAAVTKAQLDAGNLKYTPPANANGTGYASFTFKVNDGTDDSASAYTLTIDVTAVNDPATGAPTITGTLQVGQTLTAVTTGIMDADGLTGVSYTYQWIRVDAGTETNISGATSSTYTLVAADAGKTIKVKVSFVDDDATPVPGHITPIETLTSAPTAEVPSDAPDRDGAAGSAHDLDPWARGAGVGIGAGGLGRSHRRDAPL